jgi:hypothetical protein
MKLSILLFTFSLAFWACSPVRESSKSLAALTQNCQDSTEYDIIIIDPEFDHWYLLNYSPAKDHLIDYYRSKNLIAVSTWNENYRAGRYDRVIDSYIDYWPQIDYGIEVNRKLYWYFEYFEDKYRIRLFGNQQIR